LHELGYQPRFYRGDAKRQLQKALAILTDNEKKTPVVIVDEAHLLSREMLEEIRFSPQSAHGFLQCHESDIGRADRTAGNIEITGQ